MLVIKDFFLYSAVQKSWPTLHLFVFWFRFLLYVARKTVQWFNKTCKHTRAKTIHPILTSLKINICVFGIIYLLLYAKDGNRHQMFLNGSTRVIKIWWCLCGSSLLTSPVHTVHIVHISPSDQSFNPVLM